MLSDIQPHYESIMDKSNIKQELEPSTQQQIRPIPFIVSSNFLPMIPNDEPSLLVNRYLPFCYINTWS